MKLTASKRLAVALAGALAIGGAFGQAPIETPRPRVSAPPGVSSSGKDEARSIAACNNSFVFHAYNKTGLYVASTDDRTIREVFSFRPGPEERILHARFLCESRVLAVLVESRRVRFAQTLHMLHVDEASRVESLRLDFVATQAVSTETEIWLLSGSKVYLEQDLANAPATTVAQAAQWDAAFVDRPKAVQEPGPPRFGVKVTRILNEIVRISPAPVSIVERRPFQQTGWVQRRKDGRWSSTYQHDFSYDPRNGDVTRESSDRITTVPYVVRVASLQRLGADTIYVTRADWGQAEGKEGIDAIWRWQRGEPEWQVASRLRFAPNSYLFDEEALFIASMGDIVAFKPVAGIVASITLPESDLVPFTMARTEAGLVVASAPRSAEGKFSFKSEAYLHLYRADLSERVASLLVDDVQSGPMVNSPISSGSNVTKPMF